MKVCVLVAVDSGVVDDVAVFETVEAMEAYISDEGIDVEAMEESDTLDLLQLVDVEVRC
jgi:hypothetical protein